MQPCRQDVPALIEAQATYEASALTIEGIDLRESSDKVKTFVEDFQLQYPLVLDSNGEVAQNWPIAGPTEGMPSSYFIDSQGVIRKIVFGAISAQTLDEGLARVLEPGS